MGPEMRRETQAGGGLPPPLGQTLTQHGASPQAMLHSAVGRDLKGTRPRPVTLHILEAVSGRDTGLGSSALPSALSLSLVQQELRPREEHSLLLPPEQSQPKMDWNFQVQAVKRIPTCWNPLILEVRVLRLREVN